MQMRAKAGLVTLFVALFLSTTVAYAGECRGKSAEHRTALLELYTSEGCNSCPPADRWLTNLAEGQYDSKEIVPLALHVDYWNYLGWKDPFSSKEYSQRQRRQGDVNNLRSIYTPQFVLNGQDLRGWYKRNGTDAPIEKINQQGATVHIDMTVKSNDSALDVNTAIDLQAGQSVSGYGLYLAVFENALVSDIPRGENAGKTLHHDYVVRDLRGPYKLSGKPAEYQQRFNLGSDWNSENLGIAAFVQNPKTGDVLQAMMIKNCS